MTDYITGYNKESFYKKLKTAAREKRLINSARWYLEDRTPYFSIKSSIAKWHHSKNNIFSLNGREYQYYIKNNSFLSERAVELPMALWFYKQNKHDTVLEIGNVMHQLLVIPKGYDVLDKYEIGKKIINEDAVSFKSNKRYDMILSVSTIEHIGFDEEDKDPNKPVATIRNIKKLLKPTGRIFITVPLRYNPAIDKMIREQSFKFMRSYFLKRVSYWGYWKQTTMEDALRMKYRSRYQNANAIAILIK